MPPLPNTPYGVVLRLKKAQGLHFYHLDMLITLIMEGFY